MKARTIGTAMMASMCMSAVPARAAQEAGKDSVELARPTAALDAIAGEALRRDPRPCRP